MTPRRIGITFAALAERADHDHDARMQQAWTTAALVRQALLGGEFAKLEDLLAAARKPKTVAEIKARVAAWIGGRSKQEDAPSDG